MQTDRTPFHLRLRRAWNRMFLSLRRLWPNLEWGPHCRVDWRARLDTSLGGRIILGARCEIHPGAILATYGGEIRIGNDSTVNPYSILYGHGGLTIGSGVRIAAHCVLIPANHNFKNPNEFIFRQGLTTKGITIEDDVWLGAGVIVLDGVHIAHGCVIGAGAVVTASTEPWGIYAGVPARKIGDRRTPSS